MGKRNKRLRAITWEDYEISGDRYKELQYFCRQYSEKKKLAKRFGEYSIATVRLDRVGDHSVAKSPTEIAALHNVMRAERAIRDCKIIEEAAVWAADISGYKPLYRAILKNVTEGAGYDVLIGIYDLPFAVPDFYGIRRAFFYRLDRLQHGEIDEVDRRRRHESENQGVEGD